MLIHKIISGIITIGFCGQIPEGIFSRTIEKISEKVFIGIFEEYLEEHFKFLDQFPN